MYVHVEGCTCGDQSIDFTRDTRCKEVKTIDGVDQVLIVDALRRYAEECEEIAGQMEERGSLYVAKSRRETAIEARRLWQVFVQASEVSVS